MYVKGVAGAGRERLAGSGSWGVGLVVLTLGRCRSWLIMILALASEPDR